MNKFLIGMVVSRLSYGSDVLFKIIKIVEKNNKKIALLRGLDTRLMADADLNDLKLVSKEECRAYEERVLIQAREFLWRTPQRLGSQRRMVKEMGGGNQPEYCSLPGRVLHLDGDKSYLDKCMIKYKELQIDAQGYAVPEKEQPEVVCEYLKNFKPDLLVITGHDGIKSKSDPKKLDSYYSSSFFVEAVEKARDYESNKDNLIIFAGACQSYYEELIKRGANFASSPARILIHAFDPFLVIKGIAYTSIGEIVDPSAIVANTISGAKGIGGIESYGRFRLGMPTIY